MCYVGIVCINADSFIGLKDEISFDNLFEAQDFAKNMRELKDCELKQYCYSWEEICNFMDASDDELPNQIEMTLAQYITEQDIYQCVEGHYAEEVFERKYTINAKNTICFEDYWHLDHSDF